MSVRKTRSITEKKNRPVEVEKARGFERGLCIDGIVGAASTEKETYYLVKWKDCDEFDLLASSVICEQSPETLIDFHGRNSGLVEKASKRKVATAPVSNVMTTIGDLFVPKSEMEADEVLDEPI